MDPTALANDLIPKDITSLKLSYWAVQTVLMCVTAFIIPRLRITSIFGPVLAVLAIALINATVWDAALFFQVPNHFTSQMAVLLLANGALFWIIVKILPGIEVDGILPAIVAPIVFTVLSLGVDRYHDQIPWKKFSKSGLAVLETVKGYVTKSEKSATASSKQTTD